jgi:hypothetical protein
VPFHNARIIAGALIASPLLFGAVAFVIASRKAPGNPFLGYFSVFFSVIAIVMSTVIPNIATRSLLQQTKGTKDGNWLLALYGVFQARLCIRYALLEGAAFLCGIAYLQTALVWALVAMAVLVCVMIVRFPTRSQFDDWVREQRELYSLEL